MRNKIISEFGMFCKTYINSEDLSENKTELTLKEVGAVFTDKINIVLSEYKGENVQNLRDTLFGIGREHIKTKFGNSD